MRKEISAIFGYLAQLRDQRGLKQRQIADAIGASEALICRIEKAKVNISLTRFIDICSVLKISPSDIFRRWEKSNKFKDINMTRRNDYYKIIDNMIRFGYGLEVDMIMMVFKNILEIGKDKRKTERSKREIRKYFPKLEQTPKPR